MFAAASVGFGPPPAPLGRRPSWPWGRSHAWVPFSGRVGGALFRGWRCDASCRLRRPGIGALLWPCGPGACARAPPRLVAAPGCRPGRRLTLLSCVYAGRTEQLGSRPLQGGGAKEWRKQAVKKSDVVINHRCRGHESFSDFDSWGHRSQLSSAAGLVWADSSRDGGAPAACNGGAPQPASWLTANGEDRLCLCPVPTPTASRPCLPSWRRWFPDGWSPAGSRGAGLSSAE